MQQLMRALGVFSVFCMLLVLLGGALVTKTDSGAGCGTTWPLCHGEFLPQDLSKDTLIEWSHRSISAYTGIIVGIFSVWAFVRFRSKEARLLSILSVFFLVLQALIGAGAVVWGQSDFILALHFGISLVSFSSTLLLTLFVFENTSTKPRRLVSIPHGMRKELVWLMVYLYAVVYSGAFVRHIGASIVCQGYPFCSNEGGILPTNMYEWVHMGHRAAAGLFFLWLLFFLIRTWRKSDVSKSVKWILTLAFMFVSLQVISGALIIITLLSLSISLLHALFISCLFGTLSYLLLLSYRSYRVEKAERKAA
ncbi:COX15/CtaA family protein [Aureibacillus halotolerans]|uniref:Heme A synthase n=1 Tax=Aureibacillus halotolerans TaxID=1508390 RepID=A0A4R6U7F9_9BACI|nr:heme A synthase [Aureibacillus halotolerans]TDQ42281.1 cytochrome c oxidase assembly protein subunit 15 [Aureibacillus halotolerans]